MNQPWSGRSGAVLRGAGLAADRVAVDLRPFVPVPFSTTLTIISRSSPATWRADRLRAAPRARRCSSWWSGPAPSSCSTRYGRIWLPSLATDAAIMRALQRGHPDVVLADAGLGQRGRVGAAVRVLHVAGLAGRHGQAALVELADGQVLLLEAELPAPSP